MLTSGDIPPVNNRQVTGRPTSHASRRGLLSRSDPRGSMVHASQSLAEISGFACDESIGQPPCLIRTSRRRPFI
jgi:hypothetical protein